MAAALLRKSGTQSASGAACVAWTAALRHPEARLLGDHAAAASELGDGAVRSSSALPGSRRPVSTGSALLGSVSWSVTPRALFSGVASQREGGVPCPRGLMSMSFFADSVKAQQSERNGTSGGEAPPESSSTSGSVAVPRPESSSTSGSVAVPPSLSFDDFRSLIVRKKSELAILEAALDILETAPRDKRFEDLVRKHNIQFDSEKSVLGDRAVKPIVESEPASPVEPTRGPFTAKSNIFENNPLGLPPAKTLDSQENGSSNVANPLSPKTDPPTMFGRLSLSDFPAPRDPSLERLAKKRRRLELMKEYERKTKMESLNFGAAARIPRVESPPVDPLKPNAGPLLDQPAEKTYRSFADRLYEEQFGHPAPPGLKRTYPKGSFYDRCMKEKERKEREAAAASARMAARRVVPSPLARPTESVSPKREEETSDNSIRKSVSSNDANQEHQERKPGAWKCPECTFINLAGDKHCYKCQAHRGENGDRDSGGRSATEREMA